MKEVKHPDFWAAFLAGIPVGVLVAGFVFALIGVLLNALLKTAKRDPLSESSPVEFSWEFFWNDNVRRFLKSAITTTIVIFISLRFFKELTGSGTELSMLYCFGVGFSIDRAIIMLSKKLGKDETTP
jgi:H+/Cl- antiporter ClcA